MLFFLVMPIYLFFKRQSMLKRLLLFLLSFMLLVAPWSVRNKLQFDSFSLTNGYAEKTLAQRLAYNEMNWKEYGSAFIYWLPDFGDSLARKLFPGVNVERLGWSKESLYSKEARNLLREIYTLPEEARMPYLLDNHFYPDVIKHGLVSIVLAWRGIFVNKYWGLLGFVCLLICMFKKKAPLDKPLLGYSLLPFLPLMVLYASVSVSIPRYYLMLIPFYAISMGTVLYMIFMRIYHRLN